MSFLAPAWLSVAALVAAGVVVLHLLARQRPARFPFPTTRFIPDEPVTAPALAHRPTDLPLLLLRILVVALLGLALARPVFHRGGRTLAMVLLDRSRLAATPDSAMLARLQAADLVLAFDSTVIPDTAAASPRAVRGSLSAALVSALRQATRSARPGDSATLTIVSPFGREEFDDATLRIRRAWTGRIELVRLPRSVPVVRLEEVSLLPGDPLAATLRLLGDSVHARLVRDQPTADDSAWTAAGGTLVLWPRAPEVAGWDRSGPDSAYGLGTTNVAVVARFARERRPPVGAPVVLWSDGLPAATVTPLGRGCIRGVAIPVPPAGDLVLRPSFVRLVRFLVEPCGGLPDTVSATDAQLDSLRGGPELPSGHAIAPGSGGAPFHPWLLLAAGLVFAIEPVIRRWTGGR